MAERELSILVKAKGALQAAQQIGKVDSSVGKLSRTAASGLKNAGANIAKFGLVVGAGLVVAARGGVQSLAELEDATTSVDGAIKQAGLTGQLTSGQVATWANDIERNVDAAFDDKAIVQATTNLIRFGKVVPENLQPAMVVMTDLATKTGDVDSASALLGKALADPTKAAGKLARVGIILTKGQQDQIKAMVKAGKVGAAQKVILDALATSTKGAAAASKGPYRDALNILADVTEDAQRALGEGFMPVIKEVSAILSEELAKPETLQNIREIGKGLAGGLRSMIGVAKGLPWGLIGDSLKTAGAGAKVILDAFTSLPPWVQSAVVTGWGLNKLTGGALGTIVGELGKGLIRGVLGMTAGVVNAKAGVVNVVGGTGTGAAPVGGGGTGVLGNLMKILGVGMLAGAASEFSDEITQFGVDLRKQIAPNLPTISASELEWPFGPKNTPTILADIFGGNGLLGGSAAAALGASGSSSDREGMRTTALADQKRATEKVATRVETMKGAVVSATRQGDNAIVSAIRSINLSNNITIPITVLSGIPGRQTVRVAQTGTTLNRYAGKPVPI